jgi:ribosomal protein S27AE
MYRTCAFCNGKLDGDGGPTTLGVGRRLAFDEWKGRLWVICPRCSRWNLAPLDERLERIDALARAASAGRVAAATDQVALIRWQGYDLVRVGKPRRLELATWRYGQRLRARRQEQLKFVVPVTVTALGLAVAVNVAAGGSVGVFVWNTPRLARWIYVEMVGRRKIALVDPPICERCGNVMLLRARHLERARVTTTAHQGMALLLICPRCGAEGTLLTGSDAQFALRRGLTYLNLARGGRQRAEDAARLVEGVGGPHQLIHDVARRDLTLRSLAPDRLLALEMAVDERAEVEELERQWKEAEEIAEIADGMLSSDPGIDEALRRLRERVDRQKEEPG